eukprot:jgi/Tetstr1/442909/TSEL_030972.t1
MQLSPDATEKDVKRQYRDIARIYHPDKSPDPKAAEYFDLLVTAFKALTDDTVREIYKKYGHPDGPQVGRAVELRHRASKVTIPLPAPSPGRRTTSLHCPGLDAPVDYPVNEQRRADQVYGKFWGKSRTVTSLICVDFGHFHEEEAEELDAFLVHMEKFRKRQALEMAPLEDRARALLAKKQAVSHVRDCNRPDNKAKDRRKCGICGHVGHNRATCPNRAPTNAMQNLPSAPVHADHEATK